MNRIRTNLTIFIVVLMFLPGQGMPKSIYEISDIQEGKLQYEKFCSDCHSQNLDGSAHGSELSGTSFKNRWKGELNKLHKTIIATMPPASTDLPEVEDYRNIFAYMLKFNSIEDIDLTKLPSINQSSDDKWVSFSESGTVENLTQRDSLFKNKSLEGFKNLDKDDINYPDDKDWISWRRTPLGHGYSPLKQITRKNVHRLKLAWSLTMNEGSNQGTPLVTQGIMFLTHPGNIVQAINAQTGMLIWEYRHSFPKAAKTLGGPTRAIAIYEDKVFMATYDAAIVALDIRTGNLLWKTVKADYSDGYTHTSGPIIADGIVISGINGCERYVEEGCFITGHDPNTGKELWRTSTIALPGDENNDTWGDVPPVFRAGSDTWIPGSYDPQLKTFYIGTSQAKPWVAVSRGMTPNDKALYTNSTLALDPKTGKIKWFFQHVPGETIDMDIVFERILVDVNDQRLLFTMGKDGILWKLNRKTGEYIDLRETLYQNIYKKVDRKLGKVFYRNDILLAEIDKPFSACPGIYGGHNWQAASYDPSNKLMIIPVHQLCSDMIGRQVERKVGSGGYGGDSKTYKMPGVDNKVSKLVSINIETMKPEWEYEQEAMFLTASLSTAGGITFIGDLDRKFKAFETTTGKVLWETTLGAPLHGYPISYGVGDKQYITVMTGIGVFKALTTIISPEIYQPEGGNTIYVFELNKN